MSSSPSQTEARYYRSLEGLDVQCELCPRSCLIRPGTRGFCRGRVNLGGKLVAQSYGRITSIALDPIEKKPLYHFYPGSTVLSVGTYGCNFSCDFCQNWAIAQRDADYTEVSPAQLVEVAQRERAHHPDCVGIAYTYSEPMVWFEYVMDTARLARSAGLKNVLVTNGFINHEPFLELLTVADAMNIDLKAFEPGYYQQVCHGSLEPVLANIEAAIRQGCHVELTTLVVPGLNDSPDHMEAAARWIASLDPETPLHLSRYFPANRMSLPPTPISTLVNLHWVARKFLHYVYVGNAPQLNLDDTNCPQCKTQVIIRQGLAMRAFNLNGDLCPVCGWQIRLTGTPADGAPKP
ncbi:MAG: AmmeMemoRadiSam system radical SAM enzyme [Bacillota bacterium]